MKEQYLVEIDRPAGVTVERMRHYIKDAVKCWSGQFNPDEDPLFGHFFHRGNIPKVKRVIDLERV